MRSKLEVSYLWLLTAIFALVAALGLLAPHLLFEPTGLALDTIAGVAEIRAAYGGLFGTLSFVFAVGAMRPTRRGAALILAALVLGGFTLGRLLSWGLDGPPVEPIAAINLAVESVGFGIAALLLSSRAARGDG